MIAGFDSTALHLALFVMFSIMGHTWHRLVRPFQEIPSQTRFCVLMVSVSRAFSLSHPTHECHVERNGLTNLRRFLTRIAWILLRSQLNSATHLCAALIILFPSGFDLGGGPSKSVQRSKINKLLIAIDACLLSSDQWRAVFSAYMIVCIYNDTNARVRTHSRSHLHCAKTECCIMLLGS